MEIAIQRDELERKSIVARVLRRRKDNKGGRPSKEIAQYTLKGDFIQTFPSYLSAKKFIGKGDISNMVRGKQKHAGGFIWQYTGKLNYK